MATPTRPFDPTPESDGGYEASRAYLKERFATWGREHGVVLGTDAGEAPVHYKYHDLDGHLTRWTCADLDEVYLEIHPAKVVVEADELEEVLEEAKAFIAFLYDTGLLDGGSDDPGTLADHVDAITSQFSTRMADVSRFSPGKRLVSAALSEGIRLDDEAAMSSFVTRFNALSYAERGIVLGSSLPASSPRTRSGRATPPGTPPRTPQSNRRRKRR